MEQEVQAVGGVPLNNEEAVELIRKIEAGDKSALGILYERTSPLVYGLVHKILGDKTPAEEILLETYTSIWKKSAIYDSDLLPLEWLLTIARARAVARVNWHKKSSKKRSYPLAFLIRRQRLFPRSKNSPGPQWSLSSPPSGKSSIGIITPA